MSSSEVVWTVVAENRENKAIKLFISSHLHLKISQNLRANRS